MRTTLLTAAMMLPALGALAEGLPQMLGGDSLTRQILTKTTQENGGVTAAVRIGSGQTVELRLSGASFVPLAPAAELPAESLKTAPGLKPKAVKLKTKKHPRRAAEQLKRVARPGRGWAATL